MKKEIIDLLFILICVILIIITLYDIINKIEIPTFIAVVDVLVGIRVSIIFNKNN